MLAFVISAGVSPDSVPSKSSKLRIFFLTSIIVAGLNLKTWLALKQCLILGDKYFCSRSFKKEVLSLVPKLKWSLYKNCSKLGLTVLIDKSWYYP